jgi:hypothetical protein
MPPFPIGSWTKRPPERKKCAAKKRFYQIFQYPEYYPNTNRQKFMARAGVTSMALSGRAPRSFTLHTVYVFLDHDFAWIEWPRAPHGDFILTKNSGRIRPLNRSQKLNVFRRISRFLAEHSFNSAEKSFGQFSARGAAWVI